MNLCFGSSDISTDLLDAVRLRIAHVYPFSGTRLRGIIDSKWLWISAEHQKPEYASTELPAAHSSLDEADLIRFQERVTFDYYHGTRFHEVVNLISQVNPKLEEILHKWGLRVTRQSII